MKTCVITGSFDPVTKGHIYLARQALKLFDKVYMCMLINPDKNYSTSFEERLSALKKSVEDIENVVVDGYEGYAADYCKSVGAKFMLRGVRNADDLAYELDLRRQNLAYGGVDTLILFAPDDLKNVSSTAIRNNIKK